jgi:hypothetical protein
VLHRDLQRAAAFTRRAAPTESVSEELDSPSSRTAPLKFIASRPRAVEETDALAALEHIAEHVMADPRLRGHARDLSVINAALRAQLSRSPMEPSALVAETMPIALSREQEAEIKQWAADDRLWTTQETVEFNLRTFARAMIHAARSPMEGLAVEGDGRKLRPCPCCGGEAWILWGLLSTAENKGYVECTLCHLRTPYADGPTITRNWNRRTPPESAVESRPTQEAP